MTTTLSSNEISLPDFFIGPADRCERLISSLQYCTEDGGNRVYSRPDQLYLVGFANISTQPFLSFSTANLGFGKRHVLSGHDLLHERKSARPSGNAAAKIFGIRSTVSK